MTPQQQEEKLTIRLAIIEYVCIAAKGNESIADYNIVNVCESLYLWATE